MAVGREIAARWCALAEQRLHHLSEMFETGRWRRYHSELAFLENIQEAKRAVQTWRALATGADVAAAAASVSPAFGWSPATMPRVARGEQQVQTMQPKAVHIVPETAVPVRLDPKPGVLAEITEAPIAPLAATAPLKVPAAMAPPTAPAAMTGPKVPAAMAAPKAPAAMAALLPQFSPPATEIVAAPERLVEFTFSLDGLEAKYPLLRNAF
ncbi:TIGR03809 family protein [Bradyrhizobium sp. 21]|uniref:TIGR03809 family protein n=1 Tax=Bradyrhizobium sp. 21 TaxID=2782666 RepID=UPI001FFAF897|nr:TIGR03809 family protein [Bradyrhizobium sp. 21]